MATAAEFDEPLTRPRVGWQRVAIALVQGALLYWLYRSGTEKIWPATVPALYVPLLLVLGLCPVLLVVSLGHLAARRTLLWVGGAVLLVAALGWYDAWHKVIPDARGGEGLPSHLLVVHLIAALFIAHVLIVAATIDRRRIAAYATYFDTAWKLAVQLVFSMGFVGAVWLVLNLGGELFKLIKLDFLDKALRQAWFNIPVLVFAFTCAIHVTDVRPAIVRGIRNLLLALMGWLLPVVTVLVGGFLLSLPFTGLSALWATRHAASVLLGAAAMLVVMINAAWQNGQALAAVAAPVRWSARIAAVLLAPLVLLAAVALRLRVADYGWTDDRIVACACILVAACYATGYLIASLRSASLARLAGVNIVTAFVVLGVILSLFSPLADPARLSVDSQLARLKSGKVAADKFDYAYLRFHGQRYGRDALARLNAQAGPDAAVVRANVAHVNAMKDRYELKTLRTLEGSALLANLNVWPTGTALPDGFVQNMGGREGQYGWPDCLTTPGKSCDVFAIDFSGTGKEELLIVDIDKNGNATVFAANDQGNWSQVETVQHLAGCPERRKRMIAGQFSTVRPARKVLSIDGVVLRTNTAERDDAVCTEEIATAK